MTEPDLDRTLAALADPTRRGVVELLKREPQRMSELADALAMSWPAMSRHLKVLRQAGLVDVAGDDKDARARVYRLRPERFGELRGWLSDVEQFWSGQLDAFAAFAERKGRARAAKPVQKSAPARGAKRSAKARGAKRRV